MVATLVLLAAATLFRLGHVELRGEEPRRAVVALEMLDTGEFVVPHLSGHVYYNKPPLFNWAVAASLAAFPGTEGWMVRLPSLVAYWLTGGLLFVVTRRFVDRRTAIWSTLLYLTGGELLFYGTVMTGELDLFYALIVALQAVSILWFMEQRRWLALFAVSWSLTAAGFLTKGMPSLAFQGLTLVGALVAFGHARRLIDWRHFVGAGTFLLICGAYFGAYASRAEAIPFLVSLFEEASQRTGLESPVGELVEGTLRFPLVVVQLLLPWSLLAVWLSGRGTWRSLWENPWTRFCLVFCAVNLPLYWFSGELRNRYLYAFFPFLVGPVAFAFARFRDRRPRLRQWTDRVMQGVLALLVVGALAVPWVEPFRRFGGVTATGIAWALLGAALFVGFRRRGDLRVPLFALALVLARIAFDVAYLPAMNLSRVSGYPPHVERMVEVAGTEPVRLVGRSEIMERDAALGPLRLGEVRYEVPPSVAYQIPWHYARLTGRPLVWSPQPQEGEIVLGDRAFVQPDSGAVLHAFHDHWTGADLVVVRWAADPD